MRRPAKSGKAGETEEEEEEDDDEDEEDESEEESAGGKVAGRKDGEKNQHETHLAEADADEVGLILLGKEKPKVKPAKWYDGDAFHSTHWGSMWEIS